MMNTNDHPVVSVVIPSLNRGRFLESTIKSVLAQDHPGVECIVIDGGSSDGTMEILRRYKGRIKWVQEPDNGHADAINKGWGISTGEILTWLNADDCYARPDAVRKAADYFKRNTEADVVYGDYATISEDGDVVSGIRKPRQWDLEYAVKYCFYTITQPASFIRRSILEKAGWLDDTFLLSDDHELWLRISRIGNIRYAPIFIAYIRDCAGMTYRKNSAKYRVRVNEKFFAGKDLPEPFNSASFRRRAMSNAYLEGANYALIGAHYSIFLSYLLRAVNTDPMNIPRVFSKTARAIASITVPRTAKNTLRRCFQKARR